MRVDYSTWFVCLSVCESVTALAASASVYAANYGFVLDFDSWIIEKHPLKSDCVRKI